MNTLKKLPGYLATLRTLSTEERIVHIALIIAFISCFMPWLTNESITTGAVTFTAFGYFTGTIGISLAILLLITLLLKILPTIFGIHVVQPQYSGYIRFHLVCLTCCLQIAMLSIFTKMTSESALIIIRFGIYCALISTLVATVYSWVLWQKPSIQQQRIDVSPTNTTLDNTIAIPNAPSVESHNPLRKDIK